MVTERDIVPAPPRRSPAQESPLGRRLREAASGDDPDAIPRRPAGAGAVPLSPVQERLWFLDRLHPGNPVYNVPLALRLRGRLDVAALERSVGEIVRRHEALRTTFGDEAGRPVQVVRESAPFGIRVVPSSNGLGEASEEEWATYVQLRALAEVRRPFDLVTGPPLRAVLLQLVPDDHVLLLTMHHLVVDDWSIGVIWRELGALYEAFAAGRPSPLPEPPLRYVDVAAWQRDRLEGGALDAQLAYWRRQLAGPPPPLDLATDRARPPLQSFRGARHPLTLPPELTGALKDLGRRERATLYMTLLAAFAALLHRYTGQDDVVVGSPIAGRTRVEMEPLVGFFVNTLALRADLSGDPSFRELLGRVRRVALEAYAHQEVPFQRVVEAVQPERSPGQTPLVQASLALQNAPRLPLSLPNLTVERLEVDPGTAPFDLSLQLREANGELTGSLDFSTDLFDRGRIERTADHLRTLLEGAVADPGRRVSTLPLLTPADRRQVLVEWSGASAEPAGGAAIHRLFEAQVERAPGAVAVVAGEERLTYGELNERANRLAHHLRALGVGPGTCVGLCVERSAGLVVGMLGILKTGGAYVPLDPRHPEERRAAALREAGAPVLVACEQLASGRGGDCVQVVCLDADRATIAGADGLNPTGEAGPDDLAYVIYTSGSSGAPKGVAVPHRAVTRLVVDTDYVAVTPGDRVAQAANPAFDATTFEVWGALLNGARLVVAPDDVVLSPPGLAAWLGRQRISVLFLTSALFREVARAAPDALGDVRQVLFGGEAIEPRWVAAVLEHGPPERLLHVYGPTETTTFATWYRVERVPTGATTIPIGRPVAGARVYVLEAGGQPAAIGEPGDLYVGGTGLARGYLGRPELTAERFVADPFGGEPGARLYRTGDRVRFLPDGNLEFLGRFDREVKIRGFRVEPGEVEAVLASHPAIGAATVVARDDTRGGKRLVAYVVPAGEEAPAPRDLRDFAQARLPEYMVPGAVLALATLPLTPNGKVDLAALPAPDARHHASGNGVEAPPTPTEERLAAAWAELLGVERIDRDDNFFANGGTRCWSPRRCRGSAPSWGSSCRRGRCSRRRRWPSWRRSSRRGGVAMPPAVRRPRADRRRW